MKITEDFTFFIVALMGLSFIIVMATIENSEHLKIACFESNKTYINQYGMEFYFGSIAPPISLTTF